MTSVTPDTGLLCLVALCRFHQLPVESTQLAREFGNALDTTTLQRAARALGMKARLLTAPMMPDAAMLPAIARHHDGSYFIVARTDDEQLLIHDLREPQPRIVSREAFATLWGGEWLLLARRRNIADSLQQ